MDDPQIGRSLHGWDVNRLHQEASKRRDGSEDETAQEEARCKADDAEECELHQRRTVQGAHCQCKRDQHRRDGGRVAKATSMRWKPSAA